MAKQFTRIGIALDDVQIEKWNRLCEIYKNAYGLKKIDLFMRLVDEELLKTDFRSIFEKVGYAAIINTPLVKKEDIKALMNGDMSPLDDDMYILAKINDAHRLDIWNLINAARIANGIQVLGSEIIVDGISWYETSEQEGVLGYKHINKKGDERYFRFIEQAIDTDGSQFEIVGIA